MPDFLKETWLGKFMDREVREAQQKLQAFSDSEEGEEDVPASPLRRLPFPWESPKKTSPRKAAKRREEEIWKYPPHSLGFTKLLDRQPRQVEFSALLADPPWKTEVEPQPELPEAELEADKVGPKWGVWEEDEASGKEPPDRADVEVEEQEDSESEATSDSSEFLPSREDKDHDRKSQDSEDSAGHLIKETLKEGPPCYTNPHDQLYKGPFYEVIGYTK